MKEFLRQWKKFFLFAALLSCFINLLQLTFSFYMFAIYDAILSSFSYASLYSITIIALFALVALFFFSFLRRKLLQCVGVALDEKMSQLVMASTLREITGPHGRGAQRAMADLSMLCSFFNSDALTAIFEIPWTPFYFVVIFFFHPLLGCVAVGVSLLILSMLILQERWTRDRLQVANDLAQQNKRFMDVMLANGEVVNAMGMTGNVTDKFEARNTDIVVQQTVASRYAGLAQSAIKSMQTLVNVLIYGVGAFLVLAEGFNAGMIIVASVIEGQALSPFMRILYGSKTISQTLAAYRRIHAFMHVMAARQEPMALPAPIGRLEVDNVYMYLQPRLILQSVSLSLKPGEFLGLVGPNGAGKSTLMRLLLGVWPPTLGAVRLDGVAVHQWDKSELGGHLGYLPQVVELFPATVAENIARLGEVDMEEVRRVARLVGIADLIESLPDGYDTRIGKGEMMFSGGQKQRVGLARALYGSPRLLLLDEPNSNLDEDGEEHLTDALHRVRADHTTTCVIITHKFALLGVVDTVLMLQEGRVAYFGERDEVLAAISQPLPGPPQLGSGIAVGA